MRKHQYGIPTYPLESAPLWFGYTCIHCGNLSGLDEWQLNQIPLSMAKCIKGKKVGICERFISIFTGTINCLSD
jgi:hypothetical protein